jgi:hypothetical protein
LQKCGFFISHLVLVNKTFSVQPLVYGAYDQDVSAKTLLEEPRLYNKGRLGTVGKLFLIESSTTKI